MGQAAGRGKLTDVHASPDYVAGVVHFRNGVRGVYDCGAGAPDVPEVPYWWRKCRIGAQGTGRVRRSAHGQRLARGHQGRRPVGPGGHGLRPRHAAVRPGDGGLARRRLRSRIRCASRGPSTGFEIMSGLYRSAIEGGQIALPLTSGMDEIEGLKAKVPERKVLMTLADSAKEYRRVERRRTPQRL